MHMKQAQWFVYLYLEGESECLINSVANKAALLKSRHFHLQASLMKAYVENPVRRYGNGNAWRQSTD